MAAQESSTRTPRTFTCLQHSTSSRNLVVCIDGTSNQFGTKVTLTHSKWLDSRHEPTPRIRTLSSFIAISPRTISNSHITAAGSARSPRSLGHSWVINYPIAWTWPWAGTSSHWFLYRMISFCGRNLHKVIMASYRWLSDNYQDGDSIFLFGEIFCLRALVRYMSHFRARLFAWCISSSSVGRYDCSGEPVSRKVLSVSSNPRISKVGLLLPGNNEQIPLQVISSPSLVCI